MKSNQFQCAMCAQIFTNDWSQEEAEKECVENFGTLMAHNDDRVVICDDCYQQVRPDKHPEILKKAKENFISKLN